MRTSSSLDTHALLVSQRFWVIAIFYVDFIIMVKYFFQLPLFCICRSAEGNSYRLETYCQENKAACHVSPSEQPITYQVDKILGVANQGDEFLQHIIFNVLVLVALLLHRSSMMFQVCGSVISVRREIYRIVIEFQALLCLHLLLSPCPCAQSPFVWQNMFMVLAIDTTCTNVDPRDFGTWECKTDYRDSLRMLLEMTNSPWCPMEAENLDQGMEFLKSHSHANNE